MFYLPISFDTEFSTLMMHLRGKYDDKIWELEGLGNKNLDLVQFSKDFFATKITSDISIDSNANVDDSSMISYNNELPKPWFKLNSLYLLWKEIKRLYGTLKANEILESQIAGDIYINDAHNLQLPYCFNYSTYDIALLGLPMISKIKSLPPKHLYSFKSLVEQFVIIAANSTLGATGLADFLIVLSYYVDKMMETQSDSHYKFASEEDCWSYIKENITSFIYIMNQPNRGQQSAFTNVSIFDDNFLDKLLPDYNFINDKGETVNPKKETVKRVQELFLTCMDEELSRTPLTFPVVTACFSVNKAQGREIQDNAFAEMIAKQNMKFGYINIYTGETSTLSSCCRLRSNMMDGYQNSFGSGSVKIGSLGVCTINFPRLAFKFKGNEEGFFSELAKLVEMAFGVNNSKRHIIKKRVENGNLPLYTHGFMSLDKQYLTVGVNGINEACEIMGFDILEEEGQNFVLDCITLINDINDKNAKKFKVPINCEQIPGESVSVKLCKKDELLGYHKGEYKLYSNQFIPLVSDADLLDRIKLQGKFDDSFSGGAIAHLNVDERIDDPQLIVDLIKICSKMGVVYWAINYMIQRCDNEHVQVGKGETCYSCGEPITQEFTRIVGFLVPTKAFNKIRREHDLPNRVFYNGEVKETINEQKVILQDAI